MTSDEKSKLTRTLRKMQRKGLIVVVLCVFIAGGMVFGLNQSTTMSRTSTFGLYGVAALLLAAGAWAFYNNFIKLPARFDRLMKALESRQITSVQIGVMAANEAVANSAVAQWYVEVQLGHETIDLVPGGKADAEEIAAIIRAHS
jgi:hypothetical protein